MFLATSVRPPSMSSRSTGRPGNVTCLPGGPEDLVRRHDDPAVGLEADLEPVPLVGDRPGRQGE